MTKGFGQRSLGPRIRCSTYCGMAYAQMTYRGVGVNKMMRYLFKAPRRRMRRTSQNLHVLKVLPGFSLAKFWRFDQKILVGFLMLKKHKVVCQKLVFIAGLIRIVMQTFLQFRWELTISWTLVGYHSKRCGTTKRYWKWKNKNKEKYKGRAQLWPNPQRSKVDFPPGSTCETFFRIFWDALREFEKKK